MSSGIVTEVRGIGSAEAALTALAARLSNPAGMTKMLEMAAEPMCLMAQTLAPFDTGTLRDHIFVEPRFSDTVGGSEVAIVADTVYAWQKEIGGWIYPVKAKMLHWVNKAGEDCFASSVYQEPQPYMRPAFDETWPAVVQEFAMGLVAKVVMAA